MIFVNRLIGTFLFTGFFPVAPATFASLVFLLIYAFVPGGEWLVHPAVALATLAVSVPVSTQLEKEYGHDAGEIVIDEVVGLQVILAGAAPSGIGIVAAFFLFRVFDIVKPFPARRSQELPRGYGVVCDDVIAAVYTRLALVGIAAVFSGLGRFI